MGRLHAIAVAAATIALAVASQASALPRLSAEPDPTRGGRIVDSRGREVLLRGVNVNALGEYWQGTAIDPTLPLERRDPARIAAIGWNAVRLIVSWSRVEPRPGRYNERYLDRVAKWVRRFREEGLYTIVDFHQDAWGATLAARPGEVCPSGYEPAFGWDGAPGWATLDEGEPRCFLSSREVNPAVAAAWANFFADAPGPGGIGIQTRYTRMLAHVAERFAGKRAVAGIDVMNEPNAFGATETAQLGTFYERSLAAIRRGERRGDGFRHLVLFEPSVLWSLIGQGPPPAFDHDRNVVYSPHLYGGSIGGEGPPSRASFETARTEAEAFGGAPVLTGEWGGDPDRATGGPGDYFLAHQALQDEFRIGATLWSWKQSCGDPHAATHGGEPPLPPWNVFEMDCADGKNRIVGPHRKLVDDLRRGYVRRAPGRLTAMAWDHERRILTASGRGAQRSDGPFEVWFPERSANFAGSDLGKRFAVQIRPVGAGMLLRFQQAGPRWSLRLSQR
ncbi:MAG TPA: cellulase family glycosylhydrolase [Solirubrobacterales bacterium]|nr:cellulase family glycosylhydrolase [Solirubrobacterales bacterium]